LAIIFEHYPNLGGSNTRLAIFGEKYTISLYSPFFGGFSHFAENGFTYTVHKNSKNNAKYIRMFLK